MPKIRVMFVCIHNSARSQMCEAFVRHWADDRVEAQSSGIESGTLNPLVVRAMEEIGISMDGQWAKGAQEFIDRQETFDYVITVCDESSAERCPTFPGNAIGLHWPFADPSARSGTDDDKIAQIRPIRDAIAEKVRAWLASL
ncbi:MAG: arsenate reductase ArsC [Spirochaetales bacterium]|nr:arsenate reductase ArsC [Spirochaetales bacterium]